jgi:hypothetical protein
MRVLEVLDYHGVEYQIKAFIGKRQGSGICNIPLIEVGVVQYPFIQVNTHIPGYLPTDIKCSLLSRTGTRANFKHLAIRSQILMYLKLKSSPGIVRIILFPELAHPRLNPSINF